MILVDRRSLTFEELFWLNRYGGRDEKHVLFDDFGKKYVMMYAPEGDEIVYIGEPLYLAAPRFRTDLRRRNIVLSRPLGSMRGRIEVPQGLKNN